MKRNTESLRETFREVHEGASKRENPRDHGKDNLEEMSPKKIYPQTRDQRIPLKKSWKEYFIQRGWRAPRK